MLYFKNKGGNVSELSIKMIKELTENILDNNNAIRSSNYDHGQTK